MTDHNKRVYFNDLAPRWDAIPRPPDVAERIATFCRRACPPNARRVLDVGSGTGLLVPYLLASGSAPGLLLETDFALHMLREGGRKFQDGRIRRVCADALRLPLPDESFDVVLCYGIVPHLGDPSQALPALFRVVRPGGVLAVGHLMGSAELNAMHQKVGGPVGEDTLVPAKTLAELLTILGGVEIEADDRPDGYFVRARKEIQ